MGATMSDQDKDSTEYAERVRQDLQEAVAEKDPDAMLKKLDHLRAEGDQAAADQLTRKIVEVALEALQPSSSTLPPAETPPSRHKKQLLIISFTIVALIATVVITVAITRNTTARPTSTTPRPSASIALPAGTTIPPTSQTYSTVVVPTGTADTLTSPSTSYRVKSQQSITVGAPTTSNCSTTGIDLDAPAINVDDSSNADDLKYDDSDCDAFLRKANAKFVGTAQTRQPQTAEECTTIAQTNAAPGTIKISDLKIGQSAFCVVTDSGNIAWVNLVGIVNHGGRENPDLKMDMTLWTRD
jgi:hypothetical protein